MAFWKKKKINHSSENTKEGDASYQGAENIEGTEGIEDIEPGISKIKSIIAVASGKGGVGKSTVTSNLAFALSRSGHKVGVLDADLYGPSQPAMLGKSDKAKAHNRYAIPIENHGVKFISLSAVTPGDKATIMRGPMAVKVLNQLLSAVLWGELDYLLIDLPPGTGDIQLTLAQQVRLTGGVIVTTPQKVARDISLKAQEMFNTVNVPVLGVVENMSGFTCQHCHQVTEVFKKGGGEEVAQKLNIPFLGAIPLDPLVMMSGDEGSSLFDAEGGHSEQLKEILTKISENVVTNVERVKENKEFLAPTKLQLYEDTGKLNIHWDNGEESYLDPYQLRIHCPCAHCKDEITGKRILDPDSVDLNIKVTGARSVGRYGINIQFSDGHNTGIYKISTLRELDKDAEEMSL